ncbi:hypothetical protein [Methylophaga sp.]|uniref:hypothetical protein n=1 Tax=Methylophaga sp. TaxID=2024840 RepID=UPI003A946D06
MTAKKTNTTAKATQKTAAEIKADEVAAMMGDDVETSAIQKPSAPPALKTTAQSEPEVKEKAAEETEDQVEIVDQAGMEESGEPEGQEDGEPEGQENDEIESQEAIGRFVVLTKTIHTKDKAGNDVKFTASKAPQDLGEYAAIAIKAGFAKLTEG